MQYGAPFTTDITPDWQAMRACLLREGTPERVHFIELFLDQVVIAAIARRFALLPDVAPDDPFYGCKLNLVVQRFLGYDYVRCGLDDMSIGLKHAFTADTRDEQLAGGAAVHRAASRADRHVGRFRKPFRGRIRRRRPRARWSGIRRTCRRGCA